MRDKKERYLYRVYENELSDLIVEYEENNDSSTLQKIVNTAFEKMIRIVEFRDLYLEFQDISYFSDYMYPTVTFNYMSDGRWITSMTL